MRFYQQIALKASSLTRQHHISRGVIALLSLAGVLTEGGLSDLLVMLAVVIWLWLPEWDRWLQKQHRL